MKKLFYPYLVISHLVLIVLKCLLCHDDVTSLMDCFNVLERIVSGANGGYHRNGNMMVVDVFLGVGRYQTEETDEDGQRISKIWRPDVDESQFAVVSEYLGNLESRLFDGKCFFFDEFWGLPTVLMEKEIHQQDVSFSCGFRLVVHRIS